MENMRTRIRFLWAASQPVVAIAVSYGLVLWGFVVALEIAPPVARWLALSVLVTVWPLALYWAYRNIERLIDRETVAPDLKSLSVLLFGTGLLYMAFLVSSAVPFLIEKRLPSAALLAGIVGLSILVVSIRFLYRAYRRIVKNRSRDVNSDVRRREEIFYAALMMFIAVGTMVALLMVALAPPPWNPLTSLRQIALIPALGILLSLYSLSGVMIRLLKRSDIKL